MVLSLPYSTMVSFILSTTFSVTEFHLRRHSDKYQLLRLYSQFSFQALKRYLIDVDILTLPRRPQDVIFDHIFKNAFYIVVFSILTIGRHIDMQVNMQKEK